MKTLTSMMATMLANLIRRTAWYRAESARLRAEADRQERLAGLHEGRRQMNAARNGGNGEVRVMRAKPATKCALCITGVAHG